LNTFSVELNGKPLNKAVKLKTKARECSIDGKFMSMQSTPILPNDSFVSSPSNESLLDRVIEFGTWLIKCVEALGSRQTEKRPSSDATEAGFDAEHKYAETLT
jgi:hypothetical protein